MFACSILSSVSEWIGYSPWDGSNPCCGRPFSVNPLFEMHLELESINIRFRYGTAWLPDPRQR